MANATLDELCINTLRFLAVDAVQKANSGHPGAPMGAATMAYVLWGRFLKHNPADPQWVDRDRFVLSAGHASAMLYALLHLTGYDLPLEEIKRFRQWESLTPGHPEYGLAPGVEATTGPLGQGFGNGVGMAIAERWLAAHYNRPDYEIINHYTYAIVSDGDLEEGAASEAASLAGTLKLGKLIYLYDDNGISIEGNTDITFQEDVAQRFQAYGWRVIGPINGMKLVEVDSALHLARTRSDKPTLIICQTIIGYGSPNKAGTGLAHGEPLGDEEVRLTKKNLGWTYDEPFTIPLEALAHFRLALERGRRYQEQWQAKYDAYRQSYPKEARQLEQQLRGDLPEEWDLDLDTLFQPGDKPIATRTASGQVMNAIAPRVHALAGGAADLSPSTRTILKDMGDFTASNYRGMYVNGASGQYDLYVPDYAYIAGWVFGPKGVVSFLARNDAGEALAPGDLVAFSGVDPTALDNGVVSVVKVGAAQGVVVGVVQGAYVVEAAPSQPPVPEARPEALPPVPPNSAQTAPAPVPDGEEPAAPFQVHEEGSAVVEAPAMPPKDALTEADTGRFAGGTVDPGQYLLVAFQGFVKVRVAVTKPIKVGDWVVVGPDGSVTSAPARAYSDTLDRGYTIVGRAMEALGTGRGEVLVRLDLR